VVATTDTYATVEELLEAVFSERSVLKLYNEDQLPLPVSQFRVAVVRSEKLVAEAVESVEIQRKGNISCRKPLPSSAMKTVRL
jgi:predicted methyltransferase